MAKSQVQFTKDNEYYTPKSFVDRFGQFDYDPATTKEKAMEFGVPNYDTIETDGLTKDWGGLQANLDQSTVHPKARIHGKGMGDISKDKKRNLHTVSDRIHHHSSFPQLCRRRKDLHSERTH